VLDDDQVMADSEPPAEGVIGDDNDGSSSSELRDCPLPPTEPAQATR
jgi:hypothetical protein